MTSRWTAFALGVLLAGSAGAAPGDKVDIVRDLAGRVGQVVGAALACRDIARPRIQVVIEKFAAVIKEASSKEAERANFTQLLDRTVADGRAQVTTGQIDCGSVDRELADLERAISEHGVTAPGATAAPMAAN